MSLSVQTAAGLTALVFLIAGIAGFVPGATTEYTGLATWGPEAQAELFGAFGVSVVQNALHLAFGVGGLVLARSRIGAWAFLVGGGVALLDLAIYGFAIDLDADENFLGLDDAGSVLHLAVGAAMVVLGSLTARSDATRPVRA